MSSSNGEYPISVENGDTSKKQEKVEPPKVVPYTALYRYATPLDKLMIILGILGSAGNGAVLPCFSIIFGELINAFVLTGDELVKEISKYCLYFVALGCGTIVTSWCSVGLFIISGERQARRYREEYLKAILRQDIGWFDKEKTGELATRIAGDVLLIQEGMSEKVGNFIQFFSTFIVGMIVGFIQGWQLTLVIMSVGPILGVCGAFMMKAMTSLATKGQAAYASAGAVAEEVISSIRTVVSFNGENKEKERYMSNLKDAEKLGIKKGLSTGFGLGMTMFVMFGAYGLAFWYGAKLIADHEWNRAKDRYFSGGDVVTVFFAVLTGAMALGQATPNLPHFASARGAAFKVFECIDRKSPIDIFDESGEKPSSVHGSIQLKDVHFAYPSRPEAIISNGLTLDVPAGKTVALVGPSGCGKSTVIALVQRFYDPISGQVMLDGRDIKTLNVRWLRNNIGIVGQEPVLFATSIKENIRNGREDATDAEIEAAAKIANAHTFISNLPKGYDTYVGDMGTQLSGGQKQRIAIARAIVKNPRILLLDEATSALDSQSEREVQEALEKAQTGRTTIVIAHRLSTIRNADKIIVVKDGRLEEEGTHTELMTREGLYYNLVLYQEGKKGGKQQAGSSSALPSSASTEALEIPSNDSSLDKIDNEKAPQEKAPESNNHNKKEEEEIATAVVEAKKSVDTSSPEMKKKEDKKDADADAKSDPIPSVPIGRVLSLSKPEIGWLILGSIFAAANGVVFPLFSLIFSEMLDIFYRSVDEMRVQSALYALYFLGIAGLCLLANLFQISMLTVVGERLTTRLRAMSFASILKQNIAWFDDEKNAVGILTSKLATDATLVQSVAGQRIGQMVQIFAMLIAGLVIAFVNGWKLALVVLSIGPAIAIAGAIQVKVFTQANVESKKLLEQAGAVASEAIMGIRTVVSFSLEDKMIERYRKQCEKPARLGIRRGHVSGLGMGASQCMMFFGYALAFWYGATLVRDGEMTFAEVLRVFFAIVLSAMGVGQTSSFAPDAAKAKRATDEIFHLMDRIPTINSESSEGGKPESTRGQIELRDVHFHYETRPDVKIFRGLNLRVEPGTTVALVGPSGSGKSSVVSLVERFYDPVSGSVLMDGHDLKSLNVKWIRDHVGLVGQEPVLFATTIKENIKYGNPSVTDQEIEEACKMANAHNFISELPQKYDTFVGTKGSQLSGGQKQRIAIARAIVKNPRVLLLDEATSALDTESERVVQEALDRVMKGRTTIVIAHRLSTVREADKIVVISQGTVAEEGTHAQLMELDGMYAKLVKMQSNMSGEH